MCQLTSTFAPPFLFLPQPQRIEHWRFRTCALEGAWGRFCSIYLAERDLEGGLSVSKHGWWPQNSTSFWPQRGLKKAFELFDKDKDGAFGFGRCLPWKHLPQQS